MKYGVSSLSLTETLDSFLPFNFVASCFNIFYYFIWALLGGSSDTFISFLLKNQVVIKKQQNKTAMCTQNCINLLDIYCLPTGFWVFSVIAENPSAIGKKKKKPKLICQWGDFSDSRRVWCLMPPPSRFGWASVLACTAHMQAHQFPGMHAGTCGDTGEAHCQLLPLWAQQNLVGARAAGWHSDASPGTGVGAGPHSKATKL